jgi:ATP-binding cassette subfamily B protein
MDEELLKLRGDKTLPTKVLFKRMVKYLKPEIWSFLLAGFFIILNVACDSVMPMMLGVLVDQFEAPTNDLLKIVIFTAIGYFGLTLVNQAFRYVETMILQKAGQRIIYRLRIEVFDHIEKMSINQFNEMPVGALVTRVANYASAMSDFFTNTVVNIARNILTVAIVYGIMIYISWKLALIQLGVVAIIFVATFIFRYIVGKQYRKQRAMVSDLNAFISENLSGMRITQLFNQQRRKKGEFDKKNDVLKKQQFKIVISYSMYRPFITFIQYVAIAITFICGVKFTLSAGEIVAFYMYLSRFFQPIQSLADELNHIQMAKTAAERLFNLLDVEPQVLDKEDAKEIDHFEGKIEFKNVWFAYEKENWILKDVSFVINPKETCAFVGATGAGKTTILSLLVRNFEIQKGQILIDDVDIKDIKIDCLRKAVGQMLQDVFLFSGTIKTNITLNNDEFTDERIKEVCEYVNADQFINKLDNGLESEVIERGENFSQGQRQLLSFARTVIHDPQILILDEATANIDTETELLIQDSLEKMKSIGTMLVVAHRLSTIQKADQIICLQNGRIVESGTHQQLLKKKNYYYKLYQLQLEE